MNDLMSAPGEQPQPAARKPSITFSKRKSPSPGRHLPGNMRIQFRRSPTPLREVVRYKPETPVAETRSFVQQLGYSDSVVPQVAPGSPAQPQADNSAVYRTVQLQPDEPQKTKPFVPWSRWGVGRQTQSVLKRIKGKGKGK